MSLDSTAKKANFLYSLKKYIIDNIYTNDNILPIFDKFLPPPSDVNRWIAVIPGSLQRDTISEFVMDIYCVTRQDYEGSKLAELLDIVTGYFLGDSTKTDGLIRIPFYDATTELQNGSMISIKCEESDTMDAPDESKFVILSISLKMASIT
jgi:hypothetical protein